MKPMRLFVAAACTLFILSCSSSDSTSTGDDTDNGLSDAFPTSFAISSPFATGDSSSNSKLTFMTEPEDFATVEEKIELIDSLLGATSISECNFLFSFFAGAFEPMCYGPTIDYTDHPDATGGGDENGQLPSGDVGIYSENETVGSDEVPCMTAKLDELISKVEERIDFSVNLFAWMMCLAKVEGSDSLPAAGDSTDFTNLVSDNTASTEFPFTVESASLARLDDCDGDEQYQTSVTGSITDGTKTVEISMNMKHIKGNADNTIYSGRIWNTLKSDFGAEGNCSGANKSMIATSIGYQKTSATALRADLATAEYCNDTGDPFNSDKTLDVDNKFDSSTNPEGWASNLNVFRTNHDTSDRSDRFIYHWQAGRLDSNPRTFIGDIGEDANGMIDGCGYFGFSPDPGPGTIPDGIICNWAGPNNDHTRQPYLQRQCITENTDGVLVSDASRLNITYAPVNSCEYDGTGTATFNGDGAAILNDLFDIDDLSFTSPTAPVICGE